MEHYIKIAANSINKLRKQDVYRVLDTYYHLPEFSELCDYIESNRPDLKTEIELCRIELREG